MKAGPVDDFHEGYKMRAIEAVIWAESDTIYFKVTLNAQTPELAEQYLRKVYPNISTIYVYEQEEA